MASKRLNIIIVGDSKDAQAAVKALGNDFDDLDGKSSRLAGGLGKIGAVGGIAFGAAAAGAGLLIGYGTKVAADMEQADVAFTTLLGSAEKADAFIKDLQQFAAATPFEFPGLQDAASRLLAVGVNSERVIPLMTVLGDATSAVGTGAEGIDRAVTALGQMQQKGKVTGEEMLQLVEAGIPAWDALASKLGVDVATAQEMVSSGQVKVNDLFVALESRAGPALERTTGMMEKQSQTLTGMLSTLRDTATMGLAGLAEPLAAGLKDTLPAITDLVGELTGSLGPVVQSITSALGPTLKALSPVITTIGTQVGGLLATALNTLAPIIQDLAPHIQSFTEQLGGALGTAIQAILPALGTLLEAAAPILPLFAELAGDLLEALAPALTELANALAPVITQLVEGLRPVMDQLKPVWEQLGVTLVDFVKNGLAPMLPSLMELSMALLPLIPPLVQIGTEFLNAILPAVVLLTPLFVELAEATTGVVVPAVNWLAGGLQKLADWLREVIGQPDELRTNFVNGLQVIKDKAIEVFGWFENLPAMLWRAAKSAGVNLANGVIQGINWVIGAWNDLSLTAPAVDTPFGELGGFSIDTPNVSYVPFVQAEAGALLTAPTMVLAAESARARRGGGEVVSPVGMMADTFRAVLAEAATGPTIIVQGYVGNEAELGRVITEAQAKWKRAGGSNPWAN